MSALTTVKPKYVPTPADIENARQSAADRLTKAENELRKLEGTRQQFNRLTPGEWKRLQAARNIVRQDGWARKKNSETNN